MPDLVVASAYGPNGASTRVRALDWVRFLGLEAETHHYLGTQNVRPRTLARQPLGVLRAERQLRALRRRPAPERLLVSRSMGPFTGGRLEETLLSRAGWGVYDFDDAIFATGAIGIYRVFGQSAGWSRAVRSADLVIAGNEYLAEAAGALNSTVRVIPSCVDPDSYPQKQDYAVGSVPTVIWMGSPSTEGYLLEVSGALLDVHRRTGARLVVVSAGQRPLGELDAMVDRVAWDGPRTDGLLAQADCGIMPLPDTPFTRGKNAYKLLQCGAAGLPVVGTPVGVNEQVLERLHGRAATDRESWVAALLDLLQEPEADRRARGQAARAGVEAHYSYAAWAPVFRAALHLSPGVPQETAQAASPRPPR